jgi:sigma-B regulation protein RsbU (phosphoserine phosphatase)
VTSEAPRSRPAAADRPRRTTVGLLIDRIEDSYQNELLLRLAQAAEDRDVNLLVFAGGPLEEDWQNPSPQNRIYELADAETVDGLIVSAATLEQRVGSRALLSYLRRFQPLPICSIGVGLAGIPSILVDNGAGIREAVLHLIDDHARRQIAFVRGPEANDEAAQRFRGYLKALLDRRIQPDHQLVVDGDFTEKSGAEAVRILLDEREAHFQALVAANDHMALGAAEELRRRGHAVPDRIAIVGFDDIISGQYASHPLTTVRQPIARQAARALDVTLDLLRGAAVPNTVMLETELVMRRSCGCPLQRGAFEVSQPRRPRKGDPESPLIRKRSEIVQELVRLTPELPGSAWAETLFDAFVTELRGKGASPFAVVVDTLCLELVNRGGEVRTLQRVITTLRRSVVPTLIELPTLLLRAESMLHEARVLVANMLQHREVRRRLDAERHFRALCDFSQRLITTLETDSLVDALIHAFPELAIPAALVAVHPTDPEYRQRVLGDELRLVLAYDRASGTHRERGQAAARGQAWLHARLLSTARPFARVALPLYFRQRSLGLLVLGLGSAPGAVYEALRAQTSAALEGILLVEELALGIAERKSLLQRVARHVKLLQNAHRSLAEQFGRGSGSIPTQQSPDREATAPQAGRGGSEAAADALHSALREVDALVAELARLLGSEMDTLRPGPGEDNSG